MKKENAILFPVIGLIFATLIVVGCISTYQCETTISVKKYAVSSEEITEPLCIVQLSDLHSHVFGTDNDVLVELVAEQRPDLITMTGDMLDKRDADAEVVCDLIRDLQNIAPVYYCHGNHEKEWMSKNGTDLNAQLTEAGAVVLDTAYTDITVKGQVLRIGGYHGYYRYWGMHTTDQEEWAQQEAFAESFEDTVLFKLLLCHIPTGWLNWGRYHDFPVDLVLTGHFHGGQIRLPLIGGLYAPYVGLFPEYTEGLFAGEAATVVLSTGLGSSPGIPRINNPPQVVVVDLVPEN